MTAGPCAAPGCTDTRTKLYPGTRWCRRHAFAAELRWDSRPASTPPPRDNRAVLYFRALRGAALEEKS